MHRSYCALHWFVFLCWPCDFFQFLLLHKPVHVFLCIWPCGDFFQFLLLHKPVHFDLCPCPKELSLLEFGPRAHIDFFETAYSESSWKILGRPLKNFNKESVNRPQSPWNPIATRKFVIPVPISSEYCFMFSEPANQMRDSGMAVRLQCLAPGVRIVPAPSGPAEKFQQENFQHSYAFYT